MPGKLRKLCGVILLLLGISTVGVAQNNAITWYYGYGHLPEGRYQFVAYTNDPPEYHLLDMLVDNRPDNAWRVDADRVLTAVKHRGQLALFMLTHDEVLPVTIPPVEGKTLTDTEDWDAIAQSDAHLLLTAHDSDLPYLAILINLTDLTAVVLEDYGTSHSPVSGSGTVRHAAFSEDGRMLRYIGYNSETSELEFRERLLATAETRVIAAFVGLEYQSTMLSYYGDFALLHTKPRTLVAVDGMSEELETGLFHAIAGDYLVSIRTPCDPDCEVVSRNLLTGNQTEYVPYSSEGQLDKVFPLDDNHLILLNLSDEYWLLSGDAEPALLGYERRFDLITSLAHPPVSTDGRYGIFKDAPQTDANDFYRILDFSSGETLLHREPTGRIPQDITPALIYGDAGLIVWDDAGDAAFYRHSDGQVFELPVADSDDYYFAIHDSQRLLYRGILDGYETIFVYFPGTELMVPFLKGVTPLLEAPQQLCCRK